MNYVIEQIANAGRYGDDKLVHMSSDEIAGLKSLANAYGTKITKNPQTGLDEAFNLKQFLPMIAGAALGPAGIGLSALQAGMVMGAAGTVMTGDPLQGAMIGLGGYGGAGLGGALSSAGSAGAAGAGGATQSGVQTVGAEAAGSTVTNADVANMGGNLNFGQQPFNPGGTLPGNPAAGSSAFVNQPISSTVPEAGLGESLKNFTSPVTDKVSTIGEGLKGVVTDAPGARDVFMAPVKEGGIGGGSGLFKSSMAASAPIIDEATKPEEYSYSVQDSIPARSYLDRYGIRRVKPEGFAEGGLADASLSNKSGLGSLIKGSGDGMGDEIPALVSPGEYIITAQAVSALGNGNTDAGAKKLDGMMDRIYKAQTGEAEQMPRISDNVMPI